MSKQITDTIFMIRPSNFGYNAETAENNSFQTKEGAEETDKIKKAAIEEFDAMVAVLTRNGIEVLVFDDTDVPLKPDAVFPNNWITFHENNHIVTYPMFAKSRRHERREDIVEALTEKYSYERRITFDFYEDEKEPVFLEGTGSLILDRVNKICYACVSPRTHVFLIEKFCLLLGYTKEVFFARDQEGEEIYHTNVMMALGEDFAVICLDSIVDVDERQSVLDRLESTGKKIFEITIDQMNSFAGNMLQVSSKDGVANLVLSENAYNSLETEQKKELHGLSKLLVIPIPTIEKYGGGSVRCMIAEIFYT